MRGGEKLEGCFHTAANGRLGYEIYLATPDFIDVAADLLRERFGFSKARSPVVGFDEVITDCHKGDVKLLLGWDNWSGFYVLADSPLGDAVVKDLGDYLDTVIHQAEYDRYIHRW